MVPGRLGRPGPGVWGGVLSGGRGALFLGGQPLAVEAGVSGGGFDGRVIGHFDLPAGAGGGDFKKNPKTYKKHLSFRSKMV